MTPDATLGGEEEGGVLVPSAIDSAQSQNQPELQIQSRVRTPVESVSPYFLVPWSVLSSPFPQPLPSFQKVFNRLSTGMWPHCGVRARRYRELFAASQSGITANCGEGGPGGEGSPDGADGEDGPDGTDTDGASFGEMIGISGQIREWVETLEKLF